MVCVLLIFPGTNLVTATYLAKHLWTPPLNESPLRVRYMGRALRSARAPRAFRASVFIAIDVQQEHVKLSEVQ